MDARRVHIHISSKQLPKGGFSVAEQASGLRFDIYERVPLKQELNGLEDLEQLELIPNIEVRSEGEQAVLNGNLRLEAQLATDGTRRGPTIEHDIPVEITLPMGRIADLEQVGVEIEHFDVDLASNRSLNVTGVLLLKGVEVARDGNEQQWAVLDREEVFVYGSDEQEQEKRAHIRMSVEPEQEPENMADREETELAQEPPLDSEVCDDQQLEMKVNESELEGIAEQQAVAPREPKIAFSSKPAAEEQQEQEYNLQSKLMPASSHDGNAHLEKERQTEQIQTENPSQEEIPATDQLEWKKLFLSREQDGHQFSRMRMCIVQKEETLEDIAARYEMNPREILLCNRLAESQSVYEGQIIYIPK